MSNDVSLHPGSPGYRRLGLIGNPFVYPDPSPGADPVGIILTARASALRLVAAVERAAQSERPRPLLVQKSQRVPTYYQLKALSTAVAALGSNEDIGVITVSVPLDAVRVGKIRATLASVAECVAIRSVDKTIAAFAKVALSEFDRALEEAAELDDASVAAALEWLETDPTAAVASWFGELVGEREPETVDAMMKIAVARQARLEAEPEETAGAGEVDSADPMSDAFVLPVSEHDESEADEAEPETPTPEDIIASYLIAHAKAHLSPVVARGLRAYKASGSYAMAQELKITKAPKKTLTALLRFAAYRFRKVVLVYDRFDAWAFMPEELKPRLLSMLSELRWITERDGLLVLMTSPGVAPELEEQFAAAEQVQWDMSGVEKVETRDAAIDMDLVRGWVGDASLDGGTGALNDEVLAKLADAADGELARFSALTAAAIDDAAARGVDTIDEVAIEVAMAGVVDGGGN